MDDKHDKVMQRTFVRVCQITSGFCVTLILLFVFGHISLLSLIVIIGCGGTIAYVMMEADQRISQQLLAYFTQKSKTGSQNHLSDTLLGRATQINRNSVLSELLWYVTHSERQQNLVNHKLSTENGYLTEIIRNLPFPLILLDSRAYVTQCNAEAIALFGTALQDKPIAFFLHDNELIENIESATQAQTNFIEAELTVRQEKNKHYAVLISNFSADDRHRTALILIDRSAAKEAEKMRVDFVANVSHELRTPLTSVVGFVETLQGPAGDDPETRASFLTILKNQSERMIRLVADQLSLSSIERVESVQPTTSAHLSQIAERVIFMLDAQAQKAECAIRLICPDNPVIVQGDSDELTQMVQNLVENALRYGASAGEVRIIIDAEESWPDASQNQRYARITVEDDGEGIDSKHLPRLTERFYRVDKGRSREKGGTGLGLAIVKHIVNRHRGHLHITSEKGQGAQFSVFLPHADIAAQKQSSIM